jgi:hypothetical protein
MDIHSGQTAEFTLRLNQEDFRGSTQCRGKISRTENEAPSSHPELEESATNGWFNNFKYPLQIPCIRSEY